MTTEQPSLLDPLIPPKDLPLRPQSVDISLTGRCNLQCRYCFYNDEMVRLSDLPTADWLAFFQELGDLAVQRVNLSGGEIFTRSDIFKLIDAVIDNRMRYSILTNGTLITEKTIAAFALGKRRRRLDSIQISIDGSCAEVHNKSRPPNSFGRAIHGLRLLLKADFPVTVRVTINHHNVDDLENIADLLLSDLGLSGFSTNEVEQMGSARCSGQSVLLTTNEREKAGRTLNMLNRRYVNRISATAGPLSISRHFADIEKQLAAGKTKMEGCGTLSSCGGSFSKLAILHDGTIVPCHLLPTLTMGRIGVTPLQAAWQHHPSINVLRQRSHVLLSSLPSCTNCAFTGFCTGGCPAVTLASSGRLHTIDPASCYRQYLQQRET